MRLLNLEIVRTEQEIKDGVMFSETEKDNLHRIFDLLSYIKDKCDKTQPIDTFLFGIRIPNSSYFLATYIDKDLLHNPYIYIVNSKTEEFSYRISIQTAKMLSQDDVVFMLETKVKHAFEQQYNYNFVKEETLQKMHEISKSFCSDER